MEKTWNCHVRTRFSSCGWDFASWEKALEYARDQHANVLGDVKRFPSYQGQLRDYRAHIEGPDGFNADFFAAYFNR